MQLRHVIVGILGQDAKGARLALRAGADQNIRPSIRQACFIELRTLIPTKAACIKKMPLKGFHFNR